MSGITTHVLDTSRGRPAAGVPVVLERAADAGWQPVGRGTTDADGRAREPALVGAGGRALPADLRHRYRISVRSARRASTPKCAVTFVVGNGEEHYHVPLLLSPFGYSTYRGS